MSSRVGNDFKAAFALLLAVMKVNYSASNAMNYSQTLYEWTIAALITDGKIQQKIVKQDDRTKKCVLTAIDPKYNDYIDAFEYARECYMGSVEIIKNPAVNTLKNWSQSQILAQCFDINQAVLPIALSEGCLDLKDVAAGIGAGAGSIPMGKDS